MPTKPPTPTPRFSARADTSTARRLVDDHVLEPAFQPGGDAVHDEGRRPEHGAVLLVARDEHRLDLDSHGQLLERRRRARRGQLRQQQADRLDQLEALGSFLLAQRVAEQPPEQTDVFPQPLVLVEILQLRVEGLQLSLEELPAGGIPRLSELSAEILPGTGEFCEQHPLVLALPLRREQPPHLVANPGETPPVDAQ